MEYGQGRLNPDRRVSLRGLTVMVLLLVLLSKAPTVAHAASMGPAPAGVLAGRITLVRDGDIYALDLISGAETQITFDGDNLEPRWSASGNWIAYLKQAPARSDEGALWVSAADGSQARKVAQIQEPVDFAWSPAADLLAYRSADGGLSTASADGSERQDLVAGPGGDRYLGVQDLAWSPDGDWIAFDRFDVPAQPNLQPGMSLWRVRPDGGDATQVFDGEGWFALDGWSVDGSRIFYFPHPNSASLTADGAGLAVVAAAGGASEDLVGLLLPSHSTMLAYRDFVAEDPSGSGRLAVVEGGGREAWVGKSLHVLTPANGDDVALTDPDVSVTSPAWSPDGRQLAYVSMPRPDPPIGEIRTADEIAHVADVLMGRHLMLVDPAGHMPALQFTDDPGYRDEAPRWTPDGSALLFARVDAAGDVSLWAIPAAGGAATELVDGLSLAPGPNQAAPAPALLGYYGHMDWGALFDWWTPRPVLTRSAPKRLAQSAASAGRSRPVEQEGP